MYRIFISLYPLFIRLAALWNPKAAKWVSGRKGLLEKIQGKLEQESRPIVWVHCSSLGEFEQGRPIIEQLKLRFPGICLVLTFFSPSGYETSQNYKGADHIFYLPSDSITHARQFLDLVHPTLTIFVKYDFWPNYLKQLKRSGIPTLLVSAAFRSGQPFFRWYGGFWRSMLETFSQVFVQDNDSKKLLETIGIRDKVVVSGDTRFDRVLEIIKNDTPIPEAADFALGKPVIVAGSTWNEDEKELAHFIRVHPDIHFIIAPHEISKDHIREIRQLFPDCVLYSAYSEETGAKSRCLIIDNIGMLSRLYQYGTIAYVGGGFAGDGVHNVLEPAAWGKPVVYGPIFDKYREAVELITVGGGFTATNTLDLEKCFNQLLDEPSRITAAGKAAGDYVREKAGATSRIVNYIQEKRLLTN